MSDYPPAHWQPAPPGNYAAGRPGAIDMVIIHDTEGSYISAIDRFLDPAQGVSAHYVFRSADGDATQMVQEADTGFHCGNRRYNNRSIGIEHEGYEAHPAQWYTNVMLEASARLVAIICHHYGIPADRSHIIGHAEVPSEDGTHFGGNDSHTDPGAGWPWDRYIQMVQSHLNPAPPIIPANPSSGVKAAPWINNWTPRDGFPVSGSLAEVLDDGKTYTVQYFQKVVFYLKLDGTSGLTNSGAALHALKYPNG